jgi:fructose-1,6-bisphosphatase I
MPCSVEFINQSPAQAGDGEVRTMLTCLADACSQISHALRKPEHGTNRGEPSEDGRSMDIFADAVLVHALRLCRFVRGIVSEEHDHPVMAHDISGPSAYDVAIDPLDGTSTLGSNSAVGTIFAMYQAGDMISASHPPQYKQMVAAGYVIYGPATLLVYRAGGGVHSLIWDDAAQSFVRSASAITIPPRGNIYSVNEGQSGSWSDAMKALVGLYKEIDGSRGTPYNTRYSGCLVADFHRILGRGGIFIYPKTQAYPNGRLRYLYEAAPLSYICEGASGLATDGAHAIRSKTVSGIHDKTALFIGSSDLVNEATSLLRG